MQLLYGVPGDIENWMSLVTRVRWNFPGLETQKKLDEHKATVLRFMGKRQAICIKEGNEIAGVMLFSRGHNMICCLAVSPDYRRRGVASMLMDEALRNLDRTKEISVSTFRADDEKGPAPRALYEKYGFVEDALTEEMGYPSQKYILYPVNQTLEEIMEKQIRYVQLVADHAENCKVFESLMYEYIDEMNEHSKRPLPKEFQQKWINSIISMQGPTDRHLELCYVGKMPAGFLYGKIDHEDHKGFIKPGYGYIMEFYVKPEYRRKGYGKSMFERLERLFHTDGAEMMYLTADPVTGKPFWQAMGFINIHEKSPENQLYIYEKEVLLS